MIAFSIELGNPSNTITVYDVVDAIWYEKKVYPVTHEEALDAAERLGVKPCFKGPFLASTLCNDGSPRKWANNGIG